MENIDVESDHYFMISCHQANCLCKEIDPSQFVTIFLLFRQRF